MMTNLGTFGYEGLCIKVYDPMKKECIRTYRNMKEAAGKLGIPDKQVRNACNTKTRRYSPVLQMEVALRIAKDETPLKK